MVHDVRQNKVKYFSKHKKCFKIRHLMLKILSSLSEYLYVPNTVWQSLANIKFPLVFEACLLQTLTQRMQSIDTFLP